MKPALGKKSKRSLDDEHTSKRDDKYPKITGDKDVFCWGCHRPGKVVACSQCPRVYHARCAHLEDVSSLRETWICPECDEIHRADKQASLTTEEKKRKFSKLLRFALGRIEHVTGSEHFDAPVDTSRWDDYLEYVITPMDLQTLSDRVDNLYYTSTEAFLADFRWLRHNSYVYNSCQSIYTKIARDIHDVVSKECEQIRSCSDCYLHAYTLGPDLWFIEPCPIPHVLVWAKQKSYAFWPAKVVKQNGAQLHVHFFGDHTVCKEVSMTAVYLYSRMVPTLLKKDSKLNAAVNEAETHIKKLKQLYKRFNYAQYRIPYNHKEERVMRKLQLPEFALSDETPEFLAEVEKLRNEKMIVDREFQSEVRQMKNVQGKPVGSRKRKSQDRGQVEAKRKKVSMVQVKTPTGIRNAIVAHSGSESDSSPSPGAERMSRHLQSSPKKDNPTSSLSPAMPAVSELTENTGYENQEESYDDSYNQLSPRKNPRSDTIVQSLSRKLFMPPQTSSVGTGKCGSARRFVGSPGKVSSADTWSSPRWGKLKNGITLTNGAVSEEESDSDVSSSKGSGEGFPESENQSDSAFLKEQEIAQSDDSKDDKSLPISNKSPVPAVGRLSSTGTSPKAMTRNSLRKLKLPPCTPTNPGPAQNGRLPSPSTRSTRQSAQSPVIEPSTSFEDNLGESQSTNLIKTSETSLVPRTPYDSNVFNVLNGDLSEFYGNLEVDDGDPGKSDDDELLGTPKNSGKAVCVDDKNKPPSSNVVVSARPSKILSEKTSSFETPTGSTPMEVVEADSSLHDGKLKQELDIAPDSSHPNAGTVSTEQMQGESRTAVSEKTRTTSDEVQAVINNVKAASFNITDLLCNISSECFDPHPGRGDNVPLTGPDVGRSTDRANSGEPSDPLAGDLLIPSTQRVLTPGSSALPSTSSNGNVWKKSTPGSANEKRKPPGLISVKQLQSAAIDGNADGPKIASAVSLSHLPIVNPPAARVLSKNAAAATVKAARGPSTSTISNKMPLPILVKMEPDDETKSTEDVPVMRPTIKVKQLSALLEKPVPQAPVTPPKCTSPKHNMIPPFEAKKINEIRTLMEAKKQFISAKLMKDVFSLLDDVRSEYETQLDRVSAIADHKLRELTKECDEFRESVFEDMKSRIADHINEVKMKDWCRMCYKEAAFHCCWGYNYCSERCRNDDWSVHTSVCTQYNMKATDPFLKLSPRFQELIAKQNDSGANAKKLLVQDLIDLPVAITVQRSPPKKVVVPTKNQVYPRDRLVIRRKWNQSSEGGADLEKSTDEDDPTPPTKQMAIVSKYTTFQGRRCRCRGNNCDGVTKAEKDSLGREFSGLPREAQLKRLTDLMVVDPVNDQSPVEYYILRRGQRVKVCRTMFCDIYGLSPPRLKTIQQRMRSEPKQLKFEEDDSTVTTPDRSSSIQPIKLERLTPVNGMRVLPTILAKRNSAPQANRSIHVNHVPQLLPKPAYKSPPNRAPPSKNIQVNPKFPLSVTVSRPSTSSGPSSKIRALLPPHQFKSTVQQREPIQPGLKGPAGHNSFLRVVNETEIANILSKNHLRDWKGS